jgi:hypothetical protein
VPVAIDVRLVSPRDHRLDGSEDGLLHIFSGCWSVKKSGFGTSKTRKYRDFFSKTEYNNLPLTVVGD